MKSTILLFCALVSMPAHADDAVMRACSQEMDIAESSLRILLNQTTGGSLVGMFADKIRSAMNLRELEMVKPGCLDGSSGKSTWPQYNEVKKLYSEFKKKFPDASFSHVSVPALQNDLESCKKELNQIHQASLGKAPPGTYHGLDKSVHEINSAINAADDKKGPSRSSGLHSR